MAYDMVVEHQLQLYEDRWTGNFVVSSSIANI